MSLSDDTKAPVVVCCANTSNNRSVIIAPHTLFVSQSTMTDILRRKSADARTLDTLTSLEFYSLIAQQCRRRTKDSKKIVAHLNRVRDRSNEDEADVNQSSDMSGRCVFSGLGIVENDFVNVKRNWHQHRRYSI